jgi:pyruvate/2-oxoglutarate dehydrogenase complex dihydrolipoamide dehydrogenase (E3) component
MAESPDLCVIGADYAGVELAMGAAVLGVPVALIVPHPLPAARHAGETIAEEAATLALTGLGRALGHETSAERLIALGIRLHIGTARFTARDALQVEGADGGSTLIKARRFILATGAVPDEAGLDGLAGQITNAIPFSTALLADPPSDALVVGDNAHALAIAQALKAAGSARVTLFAPSGFLAQENTEVADHLTQAAIRQGIRLITGTKRPEVAEGTTLILAHYRPALDGLNLEAAGVRVEKGRLALDSQLRSDNPRLYAAGDAAGLSLGIGTGRHLGGLHARFLLRHLLFRAGGSMAAAPVLLTAQTMPPLARIGLGEAAARARGGQVYRFPLSAMPGHADARGFVALMADRKGRLLGAYGVGDGVVEALSPVALAMAQGLRLPALQGLALPFPMVGEAVRRAASLPLLAKLRSPGLRRLARFLRLLG